MYKSPRFLSANNTKILYVFPSATSFFSASQNSDDSFTLAVERSKITVDNQGSQKFSFGVKDGDLIYQEYSMTVKMTYVEDQAEKKAKAAALQKASGFSGINMAEVDAILAKLAKQNDGPVIADPEMSFDKVSTSGIIGINFNQEMLVAKGMNYTSVFKLSIFAEQDASV